MLLLLHPQKTNHPPIHLNNHKKNSLYGIERKEITGYLTVIQIKGCHRLIIVWRELYATAVLIYEDNNFFTRIRGPVEINNKIGFRWEVRRSCN
jgi:hypothetical protein